jgi:hypothetical protein
MLSISRSLFPTIFLSQGETLCSCEVCDTSLIFNPELCSRPTPCSQGDGRGRRPSLFPSYLSRLCTFVRAVLDFVIYFLQLGFILRFRAVEAWRISRSILSDIAKIRSRSSFSGYASDSCIGNGYMRTTSDMESIGFLLQDGLKRS